MVFGLALILCLLGLPRLYGATILCRCLVFSVTMLMKGRTTTALRIATSADCTAQDKRTASNSSVDYRTADRTLTIVYSGTEYQLCAAYLYYSNLTAC